MSPTSTILNETCALFACARQFGTSLRFAASRIAISLVVLLSACADGGTAITAVRTPLPDQPGRAPEQQAITGDLRNILRAVEAEALNAGSDSRNRAQVVANGETRDLVGAAAVRDFLSTAIASGSSNIDPANRLTYGMVDDQQDHIRITNAASLVLVNGSTFEFTSVTFTNKGTLKQFTFSGERTVNASVAGGLVRLWRESGTQTFTDTAFSKTAVWNSFSVSAGCHFVATNSTDHGVAWPWGFIVPGFLVKRPTARTAGTNEILRNCEPLAPTTSPPTGPACDDPSGSGCVGSGATGVGSYGVGGEKREIGRGGGYRTLCDVTDWYENGVYVETTLDRCWTEPIY